MAMSDFNLFGLSPRAFEQMVQALALEILGPGVRIYGDGPDAGREATFEGRVPYPTTIDSWSGYGVIQAKYKLKTEGTQRDADWALEQLESELKAYANSNSKRRAPDYYIFATNVVLTPVGSTGSKDRADWLFQKYSKRVPLKGYTLWDSDQISTYLRVHLRVREHYEIWTTPGDVLNEVIRQLNDVSPNFESSLVAFLQKELRSDQFVNLDQGGHHTEDKIPMANVFVDLPVSTQPYPPTPEEQEVAGRMPPGFLSELVDAANRCLKPGLPLAQKGRTVLVGGPGQGKSTLSQFGCQLYRVAILKDKLNQVTPETRMAVNQISSRCEADGIELPARRRFPFRIVLSEFAKRLAKSDPEEPLTMMQYLVGRLRQYADESFKEHHFKAWLRNQPILLVLDGLDEVPVSSNRAQVLAAAEDFLADLASSSADVCIWATTRPQGYSNEFSPDHYRHSYLVPLPKRRALHYAKRLVDVRFGADTTRGSGIVRNLEMAAENEQTARLLQSPLQVTIMTAIVARGGQPPKQRHALFKEYYDTILKREQERDNPAAAILRDHSRTILAVHQRVGFELHLTSELASGTQARMPLSAFRAIVEQILKNEEYEPHVIAKLAQWIVETSTNRLVLIIKPEDTDEVAFEIRSLQEFMAADFLVLGEADEVKRRLYHIAPKSHWRNVFLFAASYCFASGREALADLIAAVCRDLHLDQEEDTHLVFAGPELALQLIEDGGVSTPKYQRVLAKEAGQLVARSLERPLHNRVVKCDSPHLSKELLEFGGRRMSGGWNPHGDSALAWLSFVLAANGSPEWRCLVEPQWPYDRNFFWSTNLGAHMGEDRILDDSWIAARAGEAEFSPPDLALPLRVTLGEMPDIHYRITSVQEKRLRGTTNLQRGPASRIVRLLEDPSPISLGEAIQACGHRANRPNDGPWVLRAAFLEVDEGRDVDDVCQDALTGKFGNLAAWLRLESKWAAGLRVSDIQTTVPPGGRMEGLLKHGQFSLALCSGWEFSERHEAPLLRLLGRLSDGPSKSVVRAILSIGDVPEEVAAHATKWAEIIMSTPGKWSIERCLVVAEAVPSVAERRKFLEVIGSDTFRFRRSAPRMPHAPQVLSFLVSERTAASQRLMAELLLDRSYQELASWKPPAISEDVLPGVAPVLFLGYRGSRGLDQLAKDLAASIGSSPLPLREKLMGYAARVLPEDRFQEFVRLFVRALPSTEWMLKSEALETLTKMVQSQPSQLSSDGARSGFRLPPLPH